MVPGRFAPTRDRAAALPAATVAVVALVATMHLPPSYYETFRWLILLLAANAGYHLRFRPLLLTVCVATAVLFNPLFPFRAYASQWRTLDLVVAVAMGAVAVLSLRGIVARDTRYFERMR